MSILKNHKELNSHQITKQNKLNYTSLEKISRWVTDRRREQKRAKIKNTFPYVKKNNF